MRKLWLIALALPLIAAAPQRQLTLVMPSSPLPEPLGPYSVAPSPQRYQPAPLPNRDLSGPTLAPTDSQTTLAPTVFSSREQFRGDGFSRRSSAQIEQQRNQKPPLGFSLHVPFTPQ